MRRLRGLQAIGALVLLACVATVGAAASPKQEPVKLNVLFVGAHPDDEAFTIPAFGQWREDHGLQDRRRHDHPRRGRRQRRRPRGGPGARPAARGGGAPRRRQGRDRGHLLPRHGRLLLHGQRAADRADLGPRRHARAGRPGRPRDAARGDRDDGPGAVARATTATTSTRRASRPRRSTRRPTRRASPSSSSDEGLEHVGREAALPRRRRRAPARPAPTARRRSSKSEPTDDVFGVWMGAQSARARRPAVVAHRSGTPRTSTSPRASARSRRRPTSPFIIPCDYFTQIASRVPFDAASDRHDRDRSRARRCPAPGGLPLGHRALPDERPLRRRRRARRSR